jgi:hypothetical protein
MDRLSERLRHAGEIVDPPEPALERLIGRRERRHRRRRTASAVVALAIAAGGVGGTVYAMRALADRTATPDLVSPAAPSGSEAPSSLEPGEYFYERSIRLFPDAFGMEGGRVVEETWWGWNGSGRRAAESTTPDYGLGPVGTWGHGEFPAEDLSELSTDPQTLAEQLQQRSAPGGASPQPLGTPGPGVSQEAAVLWRAVTALLEMPNAEPALRAALFEVAAESPEVAVQEGVQDPVGREAVMLRILVEGADSQLFFDPDTLQLMASVEDYGGGRVWYRIVVAAGVVDSTEDRPEEEQLLFPGPSTPLPPVED